MDTNYTSTEELENILPEAAGLFQALRAMGYENTAAVADLVDNSIDANATNIRITINEDLGKIFIADDGIGMSASTLNTAIKLGGKKAHDSNSDLGKYGLGLITASLSMGRVLRVITKNDGEYNTAVLDYDIICNKNKFIADFHKSTGTEIDAFDFRTDEASSGTVIVVDNCDLIQYTKSRDLIAALEATLGQVFRVFIKNGKHIFINEAEIRAIDPLFPQIPGHRTLVDTNVEIRTTSGSNGVMHVLAAAIPDQGSKINKSLKLNPQGQGFYVLRNNREIASALEFPEIFKKHNDFNLLRIEISFTPELDNLMGVNIKKHDVTPSKEVINALNGVLAGPISNFRQEMKAKQKKKEKDNPFLKPVITTGSNDTKAEPVTTPTSVTVETPTVTVQPQKNTEYVFQFTTYAGAESDPLFKTSISGDKITIRYNICNTFYKEQIFGSDNSVHTKQAIDNVIESSLKSYIKIAGDTSLNIFACTVAKNLDKKE